MIFRSYPTVGEEGLDRESNTCPSSTSGRHQLPASSLVPRVPPSVNTPKRRRKYLRVCIGSVISVAKYFYIFCKHHVSTTDVEGKRRMDGRRTPGSEREIFPKTNFAARQLTVVYLLGSGRRFREIAEWFFVVSSARFWRRRRINLARPRFA